MDAIKVLVIGAPRSGKTWLISRLTQDYLPTTYRPTVETFSTTLYNTKVEEKERSYLFHFFEVGSSNDLLYKLYAVMCDVMIVVVDCTNPAGSQDALLLIDKIRTLSPDEGRTKIITVETKFEGSNCAVMLPDLGDIYPHLTTSSRLNLGIDQIKNKIITLKQARKKPQRSLSARPSVRDRITTSIDRRQAKQADKRNNKQFYRLLSNSDEEVTNTIDNQIRSCPISPVQTPRRLTPSSSLYSRAFSLNAADNTDLLGLHLQNQNKHPLMGEFTESQLLPNSLQGKRKFFHLCHLIEVPPITFASPEPQGITDKLNVYANNLKQKFSSIWSNKCS